MNIVFDINHPAHINFFKNAIYKLNKDGHNVQIFGLKRGKIPAILYKEFPDNKIKIIGRHRNNFLSIIFEANILKFFSLLRLLIGRKTDVGVSVGSFVLGSCLKLLHVKNIQFHDDPERSQNIRLVKITADEIHIPPIMKKSGKIFIYNGLKEWAYLSPQYFKPNMDVLAKYHVEPFQYYFIREVSPGSLNYLDQGSYTIASFAQEMDPNIKILLSLEDKSKLSLYPDNWCLLQEPIDDIHSLIYFSRLVISSGDSMAREGAMLGRPGIYCGKRKMKTNGILIDKKILFQIAPPHVPSFVNDIITSRVAIPEQTEFRRNLQNEWDDVTSYIVTTIEKQLVN